MRQFNEDTLTAAVIARLKGVKDPRFKRIMTDRKSTRLNSSHIQKSRMPSSA